jgi:hypothetical protein
MCEGIDSQWLSNGELWKHTCSQAGAQNTAVQEIAYSTQQKNCQPLLHFQSSHLHQSMVLSHAAVSTGPPS